MLAKYFRLILVVLLFGGCTSLGASPASMTPEQLKEWAKDKNANIVCIIANTPYGKGSVLYLNLDKGIVMNGSVSIDDACKTVITNMVKPTQ